MSRWFSLTWSHALTIFVGTPALVPMASYIVDGFTNDKTRGGSLQTISPRSVRTGKSFTIWKSRTTGF